MPDCAAAAAALTAAGATAPAELYFAYVLSIDIAGALLTTTPASTCGIVNADFPMRRSTGDAIERAARADKIAIDDCIYLYRKRMCCNSKV